MRAAMIFAAIVILAIAPHPPAELLQHWGLTSEGSESVFSSDGQGGYHIDECPPPGWGLKGVHRASPHDQRLVQRPEPDALAAETAELTDWRQAVGHADPHGGRGRSVRSWSSVVPPPQRGAA